jgi:hypothetical protein
VVGRVDLGLSSVTPAMAVALVGKRPMTTSEDFFDRGPGPCLYVGRDPTQPAIGDLRICYKSGSVGPPATLVAEQRNGMLVPHTPPRGGKVAFALHGHHSLGEAFTLADARNRSDGKGGATGSLVMALLFGLLAYACRPIGRLDGGVT